MAKIAPKIIALTHTFAGGAEHFDLVLRIDPRDIEKALDAFDLHPDIDSDRFVARAAELLEIDRLEAETISAADAAKAAKSAHADSPAAAPTTEPAPLAPVVASEPAPAPSPAPVTQLASPPPAPAQESAPTK